MMLSCQLRAIHRCSPRIDRGRAMHESAPKGVGQARAREQDFIYLVLNTSTSTCKQRMPKIINRVHSTEQRGQNAISLDACLSEWHIGTAKYHASESQALAALTRISTVAFCRICPVRHSKHIWLAEERHDRYKTVKVPSDDLQAMFWHGQV